MTRTKSHSFWYRLALRWIVCALGLWIAAGIFHNSISYGGNLTVIVVAGLILALINAILKPLLVLASVPFILLTLGLFLIVINGVTVYIMSKLYTPFHVSSFFTAIGAGLVIGLVNYLVTAILEER